MAEPTKRNPKEIDGVWFPVRYIWQYQCFEDANYNRISPDLVGRIATKLAGRTRRTDSGAAGK